MRGARVGEVGGNSTENRQMDKRISMRTCIRERNMQLE